MRLFSNANRTVVRAPAKVNLFLEVLRKRPDGFHDLATLMLAVNLCDTLIFQSASPGALELTSNRPDLSTGQDNLIVKAAQMLRQHAGCQAGVVVHLIKRIPMEGGLGGGSSDAAATLLALQRLWCLDLTRDELAELGGALGSDVAFFVKAQAAWCTGRGELVEPITVGRRLHLVLVCPPFGCATPQVYRGLMASEVAGSEGERAGLVLRRALEQGDIDAIGFGLHNRLSASAQRLAPRLRDYLEKLRQLGPAGALVSGSGSSVFALCRNRVEAKDLARAYARGPLDQNDKVFVVRSCASPLPP